MSEPRPITAPRPALSPAAADVLRSELRVEYARALRPMYAHTAESEFTALVERMVGQALRTWNDRRPRRASDDPLRHTPREPLMELSADR